jgi:hypothetical protein
MTRARILALSLVATLALSSGALAEGGGGGGGEGGAGSSGGGTSPLLYVGLGIVAVAIIAGIVAFLRRGSAEDRA